jgi:hypothetical protein
VTSALRKISSLQPELDIARGRYLPHRNVLAQPKASLGHWPTCPAQDGCPLHSRNQTLCLAASTSALGQKRNKRHLDTRLDRGLP